MGRYKKLLALPLAALCGLTLSGCLINVSPADMFSLPQLPPEYTALKEHIDALVADGAEYAAPTSGTNIQPVQLVDLDGDGTEEALAFLRQGTSEKPLKIYVFRAVGETYEQAAVIEGGGASIYSVAYNDMDGDGCLELIVGWKISTELQVLTAYSLCDFQPEEIIDSTTYAKYSLLDLNRDGKQELVVIRAAGDGNSAADYYRWQEDGSLSQKPVSTARISTSVAELTQASTQSGYASGSALRSGRLQGGIPALFVTGVEESAIAITDILTDRGGELVNLVQSSTTGVSSEIFPYLSLRPQDINDDKVTEVPAPFPIASTDFMDGEIRYQINWRSYRADGTPEVVETTYHDVEDGWYLILPDNWEDQVMVSRNDSNSEAVCVTFSVREGMGDMPRDILRIYTLTGDDRESKASRSGRIRLGRRQETVVYAAELPESGQDWSGAMNEEALHGAFKLIMTEWAPGDS